jgi:uncharacterized membrane protein
VAKVAKLSTKNLNGFFSFYLIGSISFVAYIFLLILLAVTKDLFYAIFMIIMIAISASCGIAKLVYAYKITKELK